MKFHSHDNWFWERLEDGSIRVTKREPSSGFGDGKVLEEHVVDKDAWGSIVASMSVGGEVSGRWYPARHFHESTGEVAVVHVIRTQDETEYRLADSGHLIGREPVGRP